MDRRSHARSWVRTVTSVVILGEGDRSYKAWSQDISRSGMYVVACEPIEEERVQLSVLLPGLSERLIDALVVRGVQDHDNQAYCYGLHFIEDLSVECLEQIILSMGRKAG